nr:MAG TPA: hypothetical protein [Bacteriophage sp.]
MFCGDIKDTTIIEISDDNIVDGYKTKRYSFNSTISNSSSNL